MADTTGTGSIVYGLVHGMGKGMLVSGTYALIKPQMLYVDSNPNNYVTSVTGSDVAYCYGDGNFYMGDKTNGVGGSGWNVMTA